MLIQSLAQPSSEPKGSQNLYQTHANNHAISYHIIFYPIHVRRPISENESTNRESRDANYDTISNCFEHNYSNFSGLEIHVELVIEAKLVGPGYNTDR